MRTVSADWASTVAQPHTIVSRAVVLTTSDTLVEVTPSSGSVTLDSTAAIRGRLDLTFEEESDVPLTATDTLSPHGNEIQIYRGVVHPSGVEELVSLGVYGIEDVSTSDTGGQLTTKVTGLDRARRVQVARFEDPYSVAAGTAISAAILDTVQVAWPDVPYQSGFDIIATATLPKVVASEADDRWEFCQGLAKAVGMLLYFDGDGVLSLLPYADRPPVASISEGAGGVLLNVDTSWSREDTYNRFIVTGENSDNDEVYRGVATDTNTESPTYYFGDFGRAPKFWSSPYVQSDAQAQNAAEALLAQELGTSTSVNFGAVPNPALEPEDVVTVVRERLGINQNYVLDSLKFDLGPEGTMTAQTRQKLETP